MRPTSSARSAARLASMLLLALGALALLVAACGGDAPPPSATVVLASPAATVARAEQRATPRASSTAAAAPEVAAAAPTAGRWIDIDVSRYVVRLMDGRVVIREIGPVAVGKQIDTGVYESTQTGLFHVYNKIAGLTYDAPYDTYIDWWVGFDPDKANGFHSFLLDAEGKVVDASTGRISNGCIRTGAAEPIFDFAAVGMPVLVHA